MTFKTEVFIYKLHPLKMTSDLFTFVHFRLNETSINFNLWQYIDRRWLDAFSALTLTACKNDPSPRPFLPINTGTDKKL